MSRLAWPLVVDAARRVVARYDTPVTLRQLFYVLAAEGALPLTRQAYKRLSEHLAAQRRAGRFPPLVDLGRAIHQPAGFTSPGELLAAVPDLYRADRTAGQRWAVYVGAEKDSLRVQIAGWVDGYGIPVLVVRGYGSQTYVDQVAAHVAVDGRPAVLLYVGDLDASGADIERDWVARTGCWARERRLAVTVEQAAGLPPAPGKARDSRWPSFAARLGLDPARPVQYEVEAIDPAVLRGLVLAAVDGLVDHDQLDAVVARENADRARLARFLAGWRG